MEQSDVKEKPELQVERQLPIIFVVENSFETFIFKELKSFGVTQIVCGAVQVTFGIPMMYPSIFSFAHSLGVMWWTGAMCFLTGIMNMLLHNTPNKNLVRLTVLVNGLNIIITGGGIVLYVVSILFLPPEDNIYQVKATVAITIMLALFALVSMLTAFAVFVLYCKHILRT